MYAVSLVSAYLKHYFMHYERTFYETLCKLKQLVLILFILSLLLPGEHVYTIFPEDYLLMVWFECIPIHSSFW